jgi:hypothetical protein
MSKAQALTKPARTKYMGIWYFWESYQRAIDNFPNGEVQKPVHHKDTSSLLDRGAQSKKVSRFLLAIQRMPKAWGARPWSSHELLKAGNNVANDLYRRRVKRDLERR